MEMLRVIARGGRPVGLYPDRGVMGGLDYIGYNPLVFSPTDTVHVSLTMVVGLLIAGLAMLPYLCTVMIYAAVKFIQEWASPLTVINYALLGMGLWLYAFCRTGQLGNISYGSGLFYAHGFAVSQYPYQAKIQCSERDRCAPPDDSPDFTGRDRWIFQYPRIFHHKIDTLIESVKGFFIIAVFVAPVLLLAERWYFFAQARHPQNIYYAAT